jgi:DNA primase
VRKYYRQDLDARIATLFAPAARANDNGRRWQGNSGGRQPPWQKGQRRPAPREVLGPPSSYLATSALARGVRTVLPTREALILLVVVNHPWLLETHAEDLAAMEFRHPDGDRLRRAILDAAAGHAPLTPASVRAAISARDLGTVLARVEGSITHSSDWPARQGAAEEDVNLWWTHVVSLHRKSRTLDKELKDAEAALGNEPSDENLAWLRDVQGRLAALDGAEALIDGFGGASGRPVRNF